MKGNEGRDRGREGKQRKGGKEKRESGKRKLYTREGRHFYDKKYKGME